MRVSESFIQPIHFKAIDSFSNKSPLCVAQKHTSSAMDVLQECDKSKTIKNKKRPVEYYNKHIKGLVHPKIKILSLIPDVVPNP